MLIAKKRNEPFRQLPRLSMIIRYSCLDTRMNGNPLKSRSKNSIPFPNLGKPTNENDRIRIDGSLSQDVRDGNFRFLDISDYQTCYRVIARPYIALPSERFQCIDVFGFS